MMCQGRELETRGDDVVVVVVVVVVVAAVVCSSPAVDVVRW